MMSLSKNYQFVLPWTELAKLELMEPTHAGSFDIAYLGCLPGFVLMAPADESELVHMVATAAQINDRPSVFRYPRGDGIGVQIPSEGSSIRNR